MKFKALDFENSSLSEAMFAKIQLWHMAIGDRASLKELKIGQEATDENGSCSSALT